MSKVDWKSLLNMLAFIGIVLIGLSLFIGLVFGDNLGLLTTIGQVIGYVVTAIVGWAFVSSKKEVWIWIVYFIAIALIIISIIVPLIQQA